MSIEDQIKEDWVRLLELKRKLFSDQRIFKGEKDIKWRDEFEGIRDAIPFWILDGGLTGLTWLFWYLGDMYCYAKAADIIASDYEDKGDGSMIEFWKYRIRNYHIYDFVPRYFSFLDHAAYFVASLTEWKLVKGTQLERKGTMYYGTFRPILCESLHSSDKIGCLTQDDRRIMYEFLRGMDIEPKDPTLNKIARNYRQDTTHLFLPGIDHITRTIVPRFQKKGNKKTYNVVGWGLSGGPEYYFDDLERLAEAVIPMIDSSFELLFKTDVMKRCLKEEPDKIQTHDE